MATTKTALTLRFPSRKDFEAIKRAAKINRRSLNFFIVEAAVRTAEFVNSGQDRRVANVPVQASELAV